jgi:hypothetical protein
MKQLSGIIKGKVFGFIRPAVREYIMYFMFLAVSFGLLIVLDGLLWKFSIPFRMAVLLVLVILFGVLHVWLMRTRYLKNKSITIKSVFTLLGNLFGIIIFATIPRQGHVLTGSPLEFNLFQWGYLAYLLLFSLPWFFKLAIEAFSSIPRLKYEPIQIRSLKDVIAEQRWTENELRGIKWVFDEGLEDDKLTYYHLRTFTPKEVREIKLERLFKGLLSLHNHNLFPQRPMKFRYAGGNYGWEFYHNPYWLFPKFRRALDPAKTLRESRLKFWSPTREEREGSTVKLLPKFKTTTIYIKRSKPDTENKGKPAYEDVKDMVWGS